ncbi:hypothetical protein EJ04DRAFT_570533 [Polyplosphaeria fusca]|uniref:Uncharacterized protein n=1 Tax=Polyplosphaeria fusca TaxID=682080 RepID=A0A9P4QLR9_9PLEO|nr:hypothetical protein EJ04DRAFT_570533 [Polyplosphaeria fusca]
MLPRTSFLPLRTLRPLLLLTLLLSWIHLLLLIPIPSHSTRIPFFITLTLLAILNVLLLADILVLPLLAQRKARRESSTYVEHPLRKEGTLSFLPWRVVQGIVGVVGVGFFVWAALAGDAWDGKGGVGERMGMWILGGLVCAGWGLLGVDLAGTWLRKRKGRGEFVV